MNKTVREASKIGPCGYHLFRQDVLAGIGAFLTGRGLVCARACGEAREASKSRKS